MRPQLVEERLWSMLPSRIFSQGTRCVWFSQCFLRGNPGLMLALRDQAILFFYRYSPKAAVMGRKPSRRSKDKDRTPRKKPLSYDRFYQMPACLRPSVAV